MKERFLKKVNKTDTCWLWTGKTQSDGYGEIWDPERQKLTTVHRLSYKMFVGEIPKGMFVCHTCDVRHCVNPKHLWLGTNRDNIIDAAKKGRIKGQKLMSKDILKIRDLGKDGMIHREIAEKFDVSRTLITRILNNSIHSHV